MSPGASASLVTLLPRGQQLPFGALLRTSQRSVEQMLLNSLFTVLSRGDRVQGH